MDIGKIIIIGVISFLFGCSDNSGKESEVTTNCRIYATSYTDGTNNYSASFDAANRTLTSDDGSNTTTFTYASIQDFVDESKTVGRILTAGFTSTNGLSDTLTYDSSKRLVGRALVFGDNTYTYTYTEWDDVGRPLKGAQDNNWGVLGTCSGISVIHSFSETERTRSTTTDYSAAIGTGSLLNCNTDNVTDSVTQVFDENSNLIQETNSDGVTTYTITSVVEQCI